MVVVRDSRDIGHVYRCRESYWIGWSIEYKFHEGMDFCLCCLLFYLQCLKQEGPEVELQETFVNLNQMPCTLRSSFNRWWVSWGRESWLFFVVSPNGIDGRPSIRGHWIECSEHFQLSGCWETMSSGTACKFNVGNRQSLGSSSPSWSSIERAWGRCLLWCQRRIAEVLCGNQSPWEHWACADSDLYKLNVI